LSFSPACPTFFGRSRAPCDRRQCRFPVFSCFRAINRNSRHLWKKSP
jgi:hypothetical protein